MLVGHVFKSQTFKNEAFGLFIDTFLQGNMGVVKGCELYNTNTSVTVGEGYFCIKGRFLQILGDETKEVSSNGYYSLICEIDLSKENTKEDFNQGSIKVVSNTTSYPTITQQDINNGGTMYQYEFARFKVTDNGITDFTDRRTFLNLESIYSKINSDARLVLNQIQEALDSVLDESIYLLKTKIVKEEGTDLNNYTEEGRYYFSTSVTPTNIPAGVNGWLEVLTCNENSIKQIWYRFGTINSNDYMTYVRTKDVNGWSNWRRFVTEQELGTISSKNYSRGTGTPSGGTDGDLYDQYF